MTLAAPPPLIMLAEDDPDDRLLVRDALNETAYSGSLLEVEDGTALLAALAQREARPLLVLLDLNMPGKDGRETLAEIRQNPALHDVPVVIFTTSGAQADILTAYQLGANSYLRKPSSYTGLRQMMQILVRYWFQTVTLPDSA